jgi:hypothetical protein
MKKWKICSGTLAIGLIGIGVLLLTHMVLPSNLNWQTRFLSAVEDKFPLESGIKRVQIHIPSGKVDITGTTDAQIAYKGELLSNASTQAKADENIKSNWRVQKNGDTLELVLEQAGPKWNLFTIFDWTQKKPHLELQIPQSLLARIETSNGGVQIMDMNGDTDIKSSNGAIAVTNVKGNVTANNSNGSAAFTDITGSVDMDTSNGALTLIHISGHVNANSSIGSIKGVSSIGGDWDCVTSNGTITLTIPEKTDATIKADTTNGSIGGHAAWQKGEKTHRSGTIGSGAHQITLKSYNGGIDVNYLQ